MGHPRTFRSQFLPPRGNFVSTLSDVVFPARPHPFQLQSAPGRESMSRAAIIAPFSPLNVFYCCRHTLSFRLPLSRLSRAWINARKNARSEPFQFARAIAWSKWRRKRRKRKILSLPSRFRPKKVRNASCSRVQWATELRLNFGRKSVCSRQLP